MYNEKSKFFTLMRHGIASKNINKVFGGNGTQLEKEAYVCLDKCIKFFSNKIKFQTIFSTSELQCIDTAIYLGEELDVPVIEIYDLYKIHLGLLDGLSDEEAQELYPEYYMNMKDWCEGKIEIHELKIHGMTNCIDFFNKSKKHLNELIKRNENILFISTRSILICFASIMLDRSPYPGGNYREIPWENANFLTFKKVNNNKFNYVPKLTSNGVKINGNPKNNS